ncbi:MAG: 2-oxoacid ferredoxin oxidoreductase [Coriobacteriia bacterium]|nr:2-oxoacid ferredoxin oxidoreductase [Coriobacteriia bacterium]
MSERDGTRPTITPNDFDIFRPLNWCPGCGNYQMLSAMKAALADLGLAQHEFAIVFGIGQHGNGADFIKVQAFHALHGRALPTATGLALVNPDLRIIVQSGDGDGYGLGMGHFVHSVRRNIDIAYIGHNNQIYGLTTGQASPTSNQGMKTPSTPSGVLEEPVNPLGVALAEGATFVARAFAGDVGHMTWLFKEAISHRGFALVDVFQPCVTFNKINTFKWYRERVYKLEEADYEPDDRTRAFELAESIVHIHNEDPPEASRIPTGIFYRQEGVPTYQDGVPQLADGPLWKRAREPRDVTGVLRAFA